MFNLSVLNVWYKILDEITLYVQLVCSCLIRNFWIESSCMFNLSVLVWFKTFGWNHPLCSTCQYFMSGSKLLDGITLYIQLVCSSCLVQNFWMETPCMFSLSTSYLVQYFSMEIPCTFKLSSSCLLQNFWMETPFMFHLSILCLVQKF